MSEGERRYHRPSFRADLEPLLEDVAAGEPYSRAELAAATAAAVISAGRGPLSPSPQRFVTLADQVGLDALTQLWQTAEPGSLARSLWALYLLRTWCRSDPEQVARLWRAGRAWAPADEVVAGVGDDADPAAVQSLADAVLDGAYRGDLAVAFERGASFFRVIAVGRRETSAPGEDGTAERLRAERNDSAADGLAVAAARWRAGDLR